MSLWYGKIKNMEQKNNNFNELIKKIENLREKKQIDLSTEEDLSIAVMHLIGLEEHFYFTGVKTGKDSYFNFLDETREIRKELLKKLIDQHEGETWCVSKHLLGATYRLIEVGTKLYHEKKLKEAKEVFEYAQKIYTLFWALRLKLLTLEELKTIPPEEKPWSLQDILNKLVDCCDE